MNETKVMTISYENDLFHTFEESNRMDKEDFPYILDDMVTREEQIFSELIQDFYTINDLTEEKENAE